MGVGVIGRCVGVPGGFVQPGLALSVPGRTDGRWPVRRRSDILFVAPVPVLNKCQLSRLT